MARFTGPKNKLSRHVSLDLGLKTSGTKLQRRLNVPPGQHGHKGHRKVSEYGQQLAEKQKLKWQFGLLERQFRRYYAKAAKTKQATGEMLLQLLERRLDNIIYRLKFAPTRASARQLITHGHVLVDGKKMSIPSYEIKVNQTISLSPKALNMPLVKDILAQKDAVVPDWITRKAAVGKITRLPERKDIDIDVNEQLIVEFYSR